MNFNRLSQTTFSRSKLMASLWCLYCYFKHISHLVLVFYSWIWTCNCRLGWKENNRVRDTFHRFSSFLFKNKAIIDISDMLDIYYSRFVKSKLRTDWKQTNGTGSSNINTICIGTFSYTYCIDIARTCSICCSMLRDSENKWEHLSVKIIGWF